MDRRLGPAELKCCQPAHLPYDNHALLVDHESAAVSRTLPRMLQPCRSLAEEFGARFFHTARFGPSPVTPPMEAGITDRVRDFPCLNAGALNGSVSPQLTQA